MEIYAHSRYAPHRVYFGRQCAKSTDLGAIMKYLGLGGALLAACLLAACEKPKDDDKAKEAAPAAADDATKDAEPSAEVRVDEQPADDGVMEEEPAASEAEQPAAETEPPAPESKPAATESEEPAAEEPMAEEPTVEKMTTEETIVVPPTVSEDAPTAPHKGESPSPNQPQPVYPDDEAAATDESGAVMEEEVTEGVVVMPPTVSEDAPKAPHKGEPPSPNQPQPVYPDGL